MLDEVEKIFKSIGENLPHHLGVDIRIIGDHKTHKTLTELFENKLDLNNTVWHDYGMYQCVYIFIVLYQ